MRVKLYRGPLHGKTYVADPALVGTGVVYFHRFRSDRLVFGEDINAEVMAPATQHLRYMVKFMTYSNGNKTYTAPAMHPDGSIFLEYDG